MWRGSAAVQIVIDTHGVMVIQRADGIEQSGEQISLGALYLGGILSDPVQDLLNMIPANLLETVLHKCCWKLGFASQPDRLAAVHLHLKHQLDQLIYLLAAVLLDKAFILDLISDLTFLCESVRRSVLIPPRGGRGSE